MTTPFFLFILSIIKLLRTIRCSSILCLGIPPICYFVPAFSISGFIILVTSVSVSLGFQSFR